MGLDIEHNTPKFTPYMKYPLIKDLDGDPCSNCFPYAITVGVLLYLSGYSHPDISWSVIQVARFIFYLSQWYEAGLKLIGCYLLEMRNKGLIITSTRNLNLDLYPDANFVGLYNYEEHNNCVCVCKQTSLCDKYQ